MTDVKVTDYQLLDHGVEGSQYFQGCGTAFTSYDHCVTGCGEDFAEALEDALQQIGEDGFDADALETQIREDEGYTGKQWPTTLSATSVFKKYNPEEAEDEYAEHDLYYYVSIRWS